MADFSPNFSTVRAEARGSFAHILEAERNGATQTGIDSMHAARRQAARDGIFREAGQAAARARNARVEIERKYAPKSMTLSIEATAALLKKMRSDDVVAATSTDDLRKIGLGMLDNPLEADRDLLAAVGAELRRRGEKGDADMIGGHLRTPVYHHDDAWIEADSAERALKSWHEQNATREDFQLPDGSPMSFEDLLESTRRDVVDEDAPEHPVLARHRIAAEAFSAGNDE